MLVLTRKIDQRILIGHNITVTVVRIKGNSVQLGIDAPVEMSIRREEIRASAPDPRPEMSRANRADRAACVTRSPPPPMSGSAQACAVNPPTPPAFPTPVLAGAPPHSC